jgi:hypothetical protein
LREGGGVSLEETRASRECEAMTSTSGNLSWCRSTLWRELPGPDQACWMC